MGGNDDILDTVHNFNLSPSKMHNTGASLSLMNFQRIFILMTHVHILIPTYPMTCRGPNKI